MTRRPRRPPQGWRAQADEQHGLLARRQLVALGLDWDRVQCQVDAGRWVARTPRVISTVTGTLDLEQRRWLAVLHAGPRSMLANRTAAEVHGLRRWEADTICVLVDDQLAFEPVEGVDFFRSRRPFTVMLSPRPGIPVSRIEPALLLWAGYEAGVREAHGILAAAVQQRLTTPERLLEWVELLGPLRRARPFRATISDLAGGSHSGAELDLLRLCRDHGLREPARQVARNDRAGRRRWTDAEWQLTDGRTLVLEVDGAHHSDVLQAADDARRARRLTARDRVVVRCTAHELRHEPLAVVSDLVALGVPAAA